jgi:N12 class adenine-specific DNA methylase
MAEMFAMQRFLQPDDLQKHKLHHFDGWTATFEEPVTAMELSPDGAGYRFEHARRPFHQRAGILSRLPGLFSVPATPLFAAPATPFR